MQEILILHLTFLCNTFIKENTLQRRASFSSTYRACSVCFIAIHKKKM
jgi:hypothetical protein